VFKLLDLEGKVKIGEVELSNAPAALRNRQVDGFATGSAHPTSMLQELGATTPIRILSLAQPDLSKVLAADPSASPVVIPAGTYPGQSAAVNTFGLPVGAFTTTKTDEQTAYEIAKSFWTQQAELAKTNPVWGPLKPTDVMALGIKLHPGAAKYYAEAGVAIPDAMK
jgi:TRAP transporter TAXI family solute receptor